MEKNYKNELYQHYQYIIKKPKNINEINEEQMLEAIYDAYRNQPDLIYQLQEMELKIIYELWENNEPINVPYLPHVLHIPYFIEYEDNTVYLKPNVYELLDEIFIHIDYDEMNRTHYLKNCLLGFIFCFIATSLDNLKNNMLSKFEDCDEERFNYLLNLLINSKEVISETDENTTYIIHKRFEDFSPVILFTRRMNDSTILDHSEQYLYDFGVHGLPASQQSFTNLILFMNMHAMHNHQIISYYITQLIQGAHLYIDLEDMINKFLSMSNIDIDIQKLYDNSIAVVQELPCGLMNGVKYKDVQLETFKEEGYYLSPTITQVFSPIVSNLVVFCNTMLKKYDIEAFTYNNEKIQREMLTYIIDHPSVVDEYMNSIRFVSDQRREYYLQFKNSFYDYFYISEITNEYVMIIDTNGQKYGCKILHDKLNECLLSDNKILQLAIIPFEQNYVAFLLNETVEDQKIVDLLLKQKKENDHKEALTYHAQILA